MEFEAIKDGKFSFYSYDFATQTGADYADIKVRKGDSFTLSTEIENIEKSLIKSDLTEILPVIDHISKEEEEEIRRQASETATAAMPETPTTTPKVRVEPPPFPPTPTPTPPGFEAVFAIAGLLAVAYPVLRRKRK
jgi:PGF-CTERM protein